MGIRAVRVLNSHSRSISRQYRVQEPQRRHRGRGRRAEPGDAGVGRAVPAGGGARARPMTAGATSGKPSRLLTGRYGPLRASHWWLPVQPRTERRTERESPSGRGHGEAGGHGGATAVPSGVKRDEGAGPGGHFSRRRRGGRGLIDRGVAVAVLVRSICAVGSAVRTTPSPLWVMSSIVNPGFSSHA